MQVIAVQLDIAWEDRQANFHKVRALLNRHTIRPGALIVLPEMFSTGFSMNADAVVEPSGGQAETFLSDLAVELDATVLGGVATPGPGGRGRNEAVAFGPTGQVIARYTKLHPFSFAGEMRHYAPGERLVTFRWGDFTVAPFICYDLRFPEAFRLAVCRGANLFAVIANWPRPRHDHWTALARARAIENQACVVAVNRCGSEPPGVSPGNGYAGGSLVIGPRGETLAEADESECLLRAEPDAESLVEYRRQFPALKDMREDLLPPSA
jgi:predicted amidohydrolase